MKNKSQLVHEDRNGLVNFDIFILSAESKILLILPFGYFYKIMEIDSDKEANFIWWL